MMDRALVIEDLQRRRKGTWDTSIGQNLGGTCEAQGEGYLFDLSNPPCQKRMDVCSIYHVQTTH